MHSHFHDDLCTVVDEAVRAELSLANLGVREEAGSLVEQGGSITRSRYRVQWQKSDRHLGMPYTGMGKGAAAASAAQTAPPVQRGGVHYPRPRSSRQRHDGGD